MLVERLAHVAQMVAGGAATAADDACPGIHGHSCIVGHQFRRAGIDDLVASDFGNAAICLGNDDRRRIGSGHVENRGKQIGCADAAIGADGNERSGLAGQCRGHAGGGEAHHGLACRVEGSGDDIGHTDFNRSCRGRLDFVDGGHGLDPDDVDAACLEPLHLLDEGLFCLFLGQGAKGNQQFPGRAYRARDHDGASRGIGDFAGDPGGLLVEFEDAILGVVQLEAVAIAAKGVGQDDVAAGIDEILMQLADVLRLFIIPEFRRMAGGKPHLEQGGAGCAIGKQDAFFFKQAGEQIHREDPSDMRI